MKWRHAQFGEVVNSRGAGSRGLPQSEWEEEGEYPVIGQGSDFIEGWTNRRDLLLTPKTAVVLYGGHTRRTKLVETPFVPGPNVKILEPEEGLSAKFLYHFLAQLPIESRGYADHFPEVRRCMVPLPPLSEQRRIAALLDKADELRAKRRATLAELDTLTQSIFLEMFGDPVTNRNGVPIVKMGDVCDVRDGTHDSPKYVTSGGYPLVTSKNLSSGCIDLAEVNFISEADYQQINKRSKVDMGDIIMPMIGTIGSPVLVDHEPHFAIKNVALIKFKAGSPSPVFVRHLLSCHYFDHIVGQKNRGGTQKFISLGDLRSFPLPLPSSAEQQEFAQRVTAIEALKSKHRTALAELDALFASLQHRAFRGEL